MYVFCDKSMERTLKFVQNTDFLIENVFGTPQRCAQNIKRKLKY